MKHIKKFNESIETTQKGICCPKCNYKNAEFLGDKDNKSLYKCIKCNTEYSILKEVVLNKLPIDLIKAKDIKNTLDIIKQYEYWKEQGLENLIQELNAKNINYSDWSDSDMYKYYLENI